MQVILFRYIYITIGMHMGEGKRLLTDSYYSITLEYGEEEIQYLKRIAARSVLRYSRAAILFKYIGIFKEYSRGVIILNRILKRYSRPAIPFKYNRICKAYSSCEAIMLKYNRIFKQYSRAAILLKYVCRIYLPRQRCAILFLSMVNGHVE